MYCWALGTDYLQDLLLALFWPSRAGPRAGLSSLRSASAWRRRRGSPRRAARASPLRLSGPWDRLGSPVPSPRPPWRRSSPRARVTAAGVLPSVRPAPCRFALRARGPCSDPPILDLRVPYVRSGWSGPHLRPWTLSCDHPRGGRVSLLVTTPTGGGLGGTWSLPGKRRVGSVRMGTEGRGPYSRCPGCARGVTHLSHQLSPQRGQTGVVG
jgi:hypothetical protein